MRPTSTLRALGLFAAGAMLIAACGGNASATPTGAAATVAPTTAPVQTEAPAPTDVAGSSDALPSFDLSSFHGDQNLESLLPKTLAGQPLTILSMTGDQFLGQSSGSDQLGGAITALGKTPADLSVAFGGNAAVTVIAFRVKGVPADTLFTAFKNSQTDQFTTDSVSYGGKSVTKITPTDGQIAYIYTKDDTMFVVGAPGDTPLTDAVLNEAFQHLP